MEVKGIDTLTKPVGAMPQKIELSFHSLKLAEMVREIWNTKFLGFIPYCFNCKEPLVWHSSPGKDGVLFHCPRCEREWVKDGNWIKDAKSYCAKCEEKNHESVRTELPKE